ncbi:MAG TPA: VOC family protein [Bacteroidia bacterium]|jgi:PhnB protein|nr:VOC family protein [Bacteroidia bacterium]
MKIPEQYLPVMPYLIIKDAKAFKIFMMDVFGATEQELVPRDEHLIMHGELKIGDAIIMYADATEKYGARPSGMFIYIESVDEIYKRAMEKGSKSLMTPVKMEYGYTAGFEDSWGNQWWIVQGE